MQIDSLIAWMEGVAASHETQVEKFVSPEDLKKQIKSLIPGASISEGSYQAVVPGLLNDFHWNHLDQHHRPYLHNAYHDSLRVCTGKEWAMSVTRWKNFPITIVVCDV